MTPAPDTSAPATLFECMGKRVFLAGHAGLLGQSVDMALQAKGAQVLRKPRGELDLRDAAATAAWLNDSKPDAVVMCAARVGGIQDNLSAQGEMCRDNLAIALSVIDGAHRAGVGRLLYVASSAVYPAQAPQPLREETMLDGAPDPSHQGYAAAKRAGIALSKAYADQYGCSYLAALPTNLFGASAASGERAHVIAALMARFRDAVAQDLPEMVIWGTGKPLRDFLHVDDAALSLVLLLEKGKAGSVTNIGSGQEISIRELAEMLAKIARYRGRLMFDNTKPDGAMRRGLDVSRLHDLGWSGPHDLDVGLRAAYAALLAKEGTSLEN